MNGIVDLQGKALISVSIQADSSSPSSTISAWIDTGFTGEIVMSRTQIDQFGLKPGLMIRAVLADGRNSRLKTFVASIEWFGESLEVEVVAGEVDTTLLGVGLLLGRRLVVDYGLMQLTLE